MVNLVFFCHFDIESHSPECKRYRFRSHLLFHSFLLWALDRELQLPRRQRRRGTEHHHMISSVDPAKQ